MYVPMNFEPADLFSEEERVLELKVGGGVEWAEMEEESINWEGSFSASSWSNSESEVNMLWPFHGRKTLKLKFIYTME